MKSVRFVLSVVLLSLSTLAFAQSDAQKSFDKLKTLAGSWQGHVTTVPLEAAIEGKTMQVSLRATSMGNALMHEMTGAGRPDDPSCKHGNVSHAGTEFQDTLTGANARVEKCSFRKGSETRSLTNQAFVFGVGAAERVFR